MLLSDGTMPMYSLSICVYEPAYAWWWNTYISVSLGTSMCLMVIHA